jgi:hypothetical protein
MTSHGGFKWPESGPIECSDWSPEPECGHGLHGLLRGEGDGTLLNWDLDAKWLVVEVHTDTAVDIGGKVKFPRGVVVHCGDRLSATNFLYEHGCQGAVVGGTATAGHNGTATAGDYGTATAGYRGTATAGHNGTATAGDGGILNIRWWDGNRYRLAVFYVGEDGIEPNVAYRCENGKAVKNV